MCKCIMCKECNGSGSAWISSSGEYLGQGRCDDFDELEACDQCGGSGIDAMCEECQSKFECYDSDMI